MYISVVVPVYNGEETISQCLEALLDQDYPSRNYEIIVVDDGSKDNTVQIVERYPVRLLNLEKNCGRIIARESGVKAARYENILLVDVRVIVSGDILSQIVKINYQPLMAGDHGEDKYRTPFDTIFYLIRKRIYAPYFPQRDWKKELWIDHSNFDQAPKGTTCLFCSRELFIKSIPSRKGKMVSDDTLLLRLMVDHKKLLRHSDLRITYLQRTEWKTVLAHVFQRGPLFNDYYLQGPSRYHNIWRFGVSLFVTVLGLSFFYPGFLLFSLLGLVLGLFGVGLILSENLKDFLITMVYFPAICLIFGAGIIKGKLFS